MVAKDRSWLGRWCSTASAPFRGRAGWGWRWLAGLLPAVLLATLPSAARASTVLPFRGVCRHAALATPHTPGQRAMWVGTGADPTQLIAFAVTHNVQRLFLAVSAHVDDTAHRVERSRLQQTITLAHGVGLAVEALGGDSGWLDQGTGPLSSWLLPALGVGRWDGVHLDIEPYTTPAWSTDRVGTINRFLLLLQNMVSMSGPTRPVEVDVPFFYNQIDAGAAGPALDAAVLACVNSVAIMAYRNTATGPDGTQALADATLAAAQAAGKQAHVGQETNNLNPPAPWPPDPSLTKQTFYGMTAAAMEAVLGPLNTALTTAHPSYNGLSIQDYNGWQTI